MSAEQPDMRKPAQTRKQPKEQRTIDGSGPARSRVRSVITRLASADIDGPGSFLSAPLPTDLDGWLIHSSVLATWLL
jgi:hypothetical protein